MLMTMGVAVCSGLRVKGGPFYLHLKPHCPNHLIKYMVMGIAQPVAADFKFHMTVTQMIAEPGQIQRIGTGDGRNRFHGSLDADTYTIFAGKQITITQNHTTLQYNPCVIAIIQPNLQTAPVPFFPWERQGTEKVTRIFGYYFNEIKHATPSLPL